MHEMCVDIIIMFVYKDTLKGKLSVCRSIQIVMHVLRLHTALVTHRAILPHSLALHSAFVLCNCPCQPSPHAATHSFFLSLDQLLDPGKGTARLHAHKNAHLHQPCIGISQPECSCLLSLIHLQWTAFCVSMEMLANPGVYQLDESASLRSAVCAAANMPEGQAEEALCQLSTSNPGQLEELIRQHGNFSAQVIAVELGAIAERVGVLEERVEAHEERLEVHEGRLVMQVEQMHAVHEDVRGVQGDVSKLALLVQQLDQAASRQEYTQLASYLREWWAQAFKKRTKVVPVGTFFRKLILWFKDNK